MTHSGDNEIAYMYLLTVHFTSKNCHSHPALAFLIRGVERCDDREGPFAAADAQKAEAQQAQA